MMLNKINLYFSQSVVSSRSLISFFLQMSTLIFLSIIVSENGNNTCSINNSGKKLEEIFCAN